MPESLAAIALRLLSDTAAPAAGDGDGILKSGLKSVRISNAPSGFASVVSLKHGLRWIKQKRAEVLAPGLIRLTPSFQQAIIRSLSPQKSEGAGYDEIRRVLTSTEKRNLPLIELPSRQRRRR